MELFYAEGEAQGVLNHWSRREPTAMDLHHYSVWIKGDETCIAASFLNFIRLLRIACSQFLELNYCSRSIYLLVEYH